MRWRQRICILSKQDTNIVSNKWKYTHQRVSDTLWTEKYQYFVFLTGKSKENGAETKDMAYWTCKTQIPPQISKNKLTKDILTVFDCKMQQKWYWDKVYGRESTHITIYIGNELNYSHLDVSDALQT